MTTTTDETWWPVTVTWPDGDQITDAVLATGPADARASAEDNWPGASITLAPHPTS